MIPLVDSRGAAVPAVVGVEHLERLVTGSHGVIELLRELERNDVVVFAVYSVERAADALGDAG